MTNDNKKAISYIRTGGIAAIVYTIDEIHLKIKPIAEKYGLRAVYLFGSYARGEATENSDVDFLIDTEGTSLTSLFALGALYSDLEEVLEKGIDLITVSTLRQEIRSVSEASFRDTVWNEKVRIYAAA